MSDDSKARMEPAKNVVASRLFLFAAYAGLIVLCFSILPRTSGPLWLAISFLILAVPSGMFTIYLATLRRIHWLSMWSPDSFAVRWLSGPWLRLTFGTLMAFLTAFLLSLRLSVAGWIDITLLAICAVTLGLVLYAFGNWLRSQFQPLYRHGRPLFWAAFISAGLMSLLDPAMRFFIGAYGTYETVREAIEAVRQQATWLGDSALSQFVAGLGGSWVGFEQFLLGRLVENPGLGTWLGLAMSGLIRFPLYLAAGITFCAFVLPLHEYKRLLLTSSSGMEDGILTASRIAWVSATTTILIFFIYFPVIAVMETAIEKRPAVRSPEAMVIQSVELIGDHYHSAGTVEAVNRLAISMVDERGDELDRLEIALEDGFSLMRENVDSYLDWYYSLPGEWARVVTLLTGNVEDYLARKLSEELAAGQPFGDFEQAVEVALSGEALRQEEFRELAAELLATRRVEVAPEGEIEVVAQVEREELLTLSAHSGVTTLEQRLGVTAATSGVSGVIAAAATRQVLARVAARGTIRAAAAAIARLATIRAASSGGGVAAGAAVGGAIGSVVPGIGTAIGATVGGVIGGVSAGAGAEFLILKLEELWSREGHRDELLAAIDDAEAEIRQRFALETSVGPRGDQ